MGVVMTRAQGRRTQRLALGKRDSAHDDAELDQYPQHGSQNEFRHRQAQLPGATVQDGRCSLPPVPGAAAIQLVLFKQIARERFEAIARAEMFEKPCGHAWRNSQGHAAPPVRAGRSALSRRSVACASRASWTPAAVAVK